MAYLITAIVPIYLRPRVAPSWQVQSHVCRKRHASRRCTNGSCFLGAQIGALEERIRERIATLGWVRLLKTLPGVGTILGATIYLEIGEVGRFATPEKLASYAGLVPTVHASGGKMWQGPTPRCANHFLKWAFVEAANVIVAHQKQWPQRHAVRLYQRLKASKCHGKAATAVARHLAESSWWILTKKQAYREPAPATMSSSENG